MIWVCLRVYVRWGLGSGDERGETGLAVRRQAYATLKAKALLAQHVFEKATNLAAPSAPASAAAAYCRSRAKTLTPAFPLPHRALQELKGLQSITIHKLAFDELATAGDERVRAALPGEPVIVFTA